MIPQNFNRSTNVAMEHNGKVFLLWRLLKPKLLTKTNIKIMKNIEIKDIQSHSRNTVLCDGFLIPMTDFVNNVGNMENYPSHENALSWIYNYSIFLKQPLKLEMFVPCDEIIEVMNYEEIKQSVIEGTDSWDAYEKAKEKVLFEGFELKEIGSICAPNKLVIGEFDEFEKSVKFYYTMEKLAEYKAFQLSQTALNVIFG